MFNGHFKCGIMPYKVERERIMRRWDAWRKYIAGGGKASWPRDELEIILDIYDEDIDNLQKEIECLKKQK